MSRMSPEQTRKLMEHVKTMIPKKTKVTEYYDMSPKLEGWSDENPEKCPQCHCDCDENGKCEGCHKDSSECTCSPKEPMPNESKYVKEYNSDNINDLERDNAFSGKQEKDSNELYVEYFKEMPGEQPFMMNGEKFEYCWAKYPDGKTDIGVYAYHGDVTYGYNAWRKQHNIKTETTVSEEPRVNETRKLINKAFSLLSIKR